MVARCTMDAQAMFTAQQMQYKQMYAGIDPTGRYKTNTGTKSERNPNPKLNKSKDEWSDERGPVEFRLI